MDDRPIGNSSFAGAPVAYARERLRSLAAARHSIGARLLLGVFLLSSFVTLLLTAVQIYADYRRDVADVESRLNRIGEIYLDSLAEGLWTLNKTQLQLQLDALLRLPDIRGVEIREADSEGNTPFIKLSRDPEKSMFARQYPLHYSVEGRDRVIGTLRIEATHANIYRRLVNTASTILVTQAVTIFLVSLFILYFFRQLVTRHLSAIATDVGRHGITGEPLELKLRRRPPRHEDELQRVITAINTLSHNLHNAYRDLAEREAKIRRLVDANIIGVFTWEVVGRTLEDRDAVFRDVNDAFLRIVGYDREELVTGSVGQRILTPPDWQERTQRAMAEMKLTGAFQPYEKEYIRKDGTRVPVLIGAAQFDESGEQGVAFVLDLTEQKRAEVVGRRLATIVSSSEDAIVSKDLNGTIESWNSGAEKLFGYHASEVIGKSILIVIPPDRHDEERIILERIKRGEPIEHYETVRMRKDGSLLEVSLTVSPVRDVAGRIVGASKIARDITARKRAEHALRESEEQWKAVFQNNPVMYFMVNEAGTIISVNPFGAEQLGFSANELIGRPVRGLFHEADRALVQMNAARCFEKPGQAMSWELRKVRKSGEIIWVRETARASLIRNRLVLLIVCEDITEGKQAAEALVEVQTELAHANRVAALGQLTASIAHEINQPIAGVLNSGQAALRWLDRSDLEAARRAIERIVRDATRAGQVISGVRTFVRKVPPQAESFDINDTIREVIVITRGEAAKSGVLVQTQLADDLPLVQGIRVSLQQVILNLVINAIEAMSSISDRPRELLIKTARTESGSISVAVQDSGPGIDPANADRAFEAFYTTKPDGMGMGLSICRSIVEAHGGELDIIANVPRGAIFRFTVPCGRTADAS